MAVCHLVAGDRSRHNYYHCGENGNCVRIIDRWF